MLKGGVIGFGSVGQNMTKYINKTDCARIVIVCNRGKEKLEIAKRNFGLLTTHSPEELLKTDIDFVLVTSSNYAHKEHVMLAARAGKHIFCEKPIALNLKDTDEMIEEVEKSGVINAVNYSLRYLPGYRRIKKLIEGSELGDILSVFIFRSRGFGLYSSGARHWAITRAEESGGWTIHHACHGLDLLYWFGGPIEEVYAKSTTTVPNAGTEEIVWGLIKFQTTGIGMIGDSISKMREHYGNVIGTKASLVFSAEKDNLLLRIFRENSDTPEVINIGNKKHMAGVDHFLDCLKKVKPSENTIKDGRSSLAAAIAMKRSYKTNSPEKI